MHPEWKLDAQIPSMFPLPTIPYKAVYTITYNVGASGNVAWVYRPVYLSDTTTNSSTFYYNANANLDGTTATGWNVGKMIPTVPPGVASAFRIVSASVVTSVRGVITNLSGRLATAIHTDSCTMTPIVNTTSTTFSISDAEYNTAAITDNSQHMAYCYVSPSAAVRSIYLPFDPSFHNFLPVNTSRLNLSPTTPDDFIFIGYGSGLAAGSTVEHRIYVNYELEPHGTPFNLSLAKTCEDRKDSSKSMKEIADNVANASTAGTLDMISNASNIAKEILGIHDEFRKRRMGFKDYGWLNNVAERFYDPSGNVGYAKGYV